MKSMWFLLWAVLVTPAKSLVVPSLQQPQCNLRRTRLLPLNWSNRATPTRSKFAPARLFATVPTDGQVIKTSQGKKRISVGMAFLTGWANACLVTKYKSFATMMTGNTMWMASAAFDGRFKDVGYYASLIVCYCLGLAGFRRADLQFKNKSLTYVCGPLAMALFVGSDALSRFNPGNRWPPMVLLSLAFGIVNSVGTEVTGNLTFVITGHMTKLTNSLVDRVSRTAGRKRLTPADKEAATQNAMTIGAFFFGALWAWGFLAKAPLLMKNNTFTLVGILYGAIFFWHDRETMGAWWQKDDGMCEMDALETTCE